MRNLGVKTIPEVSFSLLTFLNTVAGRLKEILKGKPFISLSAFFLKPASYFYVMALRTPKLFHRLADVLRSNDLSENGKRKCEKNSFFSFQGDYFQKI
jgi:hypothetical protein